MVDRVVNIKTSDAGWILERLAREISDRYTYVDVNGEGSYPLTYYMTYGARVVRESPIELALFTHLEEDPGARAKYFAVANDMNVCVTMSPRYEKELLEAGLSDVRTIRPGVDLERYSVRVKVGVVGRTYHTGRKGEALVSSVLDTPGIEWHFTGSGWPKPSRHVSDEDMPAFMREMDYVLIPSLYEGGPMSVIEALACGTPVIASDVGWVNDYPHIPFAHGNAGDLRRVLEEIVEERLALRRRVEGQDWASWANAHHELFSELVGEAGPGTRLESEATPETPSEVAVVLHGNERNSRGGPTTRAPQLAHLLNNSATTAAVHHGVPIRRTSSSVAHVFNSWQPHSARRQLEAAQSKGFATVFSPILLDFREFELWGSVLPEIFDLDVDVDVLDALLRQLAADLSNRPLARRDPVPGYSSNLRHCFDSSDAVIFLSEREREVAAALGIDSEKTFLIHNPVKVDEWSAPSSSGLPPELAGREYVLCIGRIEGRKNQAMLQHALRQTNLPLVFLGHAPTGGGSPADRYAQNLIKRAHPNTVFVDRLPSGGEEMRAIVQRARVVAMPSWAEGASLAALEAFCAGANLVLSDRSSEQEYFGDLVRLCDPLNPDSIRDQVLAAWDANPGHVRRIEQTEYARDRFSWAEHVEKTREAYAAAIARHRSHLGRTSSARSTSGVSDSPPASSRSAGGGGDSSQWVVDVTTSCIEANQNSGISRVEREVSAALAQAGAATPSSYVAWDGKRRRFVEVAVDAVAGRWAHRYVQHQFAVQDSQSRLARGATLFVMGSAWMQNGKYVAGIAQLQREHGLRLVLLVHDLIPILFPQWMPEGYSFKFAANLRNMVSMASLLLTDSASTQRDIADWLRNEGLPNRQIRVLHLSGTFQAEGLGAGGMEAKAVDHPRPRDFEGRRYALVVGSIHRRKNYDHLALVWKQLLDRLGRRCPDLVIVGGVSWNGRDTYRALTEDPLLKGHVHVLSDVNDEELDSLYSDCLFTLYPSLYEGWGLPVAESLARGKICLASDISSIPEVAPDITDLLDPYSVSEWVTRAYRYIVNEGDRLSREEVIRERYEKRSWSEVAQGVICELADVPCLEVAAEYPAYGDAVCVNSTEAAIRHLGPGWHNPEAWGVWSSQSTSFLRVQLPREATRDGSELVLRCLALGGARYPMSARAYSGETLLGEFVFSDDEFHDWRIALDGLPGLTSSLDLRLSVSRVINIGEVRGTSDKRSVGLGLTSWLVGERTSNGGRSVEVALGRGTLTSNVGTESLQVRRGGAPAPAEAWDGPWGVEAAEGALAVEVRTHSVGYQRGKVRLLVRGVASPDAPVRMAVLSGGSLLSTHIVDTDQHLWLDATYEIPQGSTTTEVVLLSTIERNVSPNSLGLGSEKRVFDFGLGSAELVPESHTAIGAGLLLSHETLWRLTPSDEGWHDASAGWYPPDDDGAWTRGVSGHVQLVLNATASPTSVLTVSLVAPEAPSPLVVCLRWEGKPILSRPVEPGTRAVLACRLDDIPNSTCGSGRLTMEVDQSWNGFRVKGGGDDRDVGIRLEAVQILGYCEQFYLSRNPDVRRAVRKGTFGAGIDHFLAFGVAEQRPGDGGRDQ